MVSQFHRIGCVWKAPFCTNVTESAEILRKNYPGQNQVKFGFPNPKVGQGVFLDDPTS